MKATNSNRKTARLAGLLYLFLAIIGAFSLLYVPSRFITPGDAAATAADILASESLFRVGIVSGLIYQVLFLILVLVLYKLLRGVNQTHAVLMVTLAVPAVPVGILNMLNQFAALHLLDGAGYLTVFDPDQINAMAMLFLDLHGYGILFAEIFWGLWLLPFGLLIIKSGFIPKVLGVLLIIGCFGYLIDVLARSLLPDYAAMISPVAGVAKFGEPVIILWLLIVGAREPRRGAGDGGHPDS